MRSKPQSITLTTTPMKIADIKAIGQKLSVHTKTTSAEASFLYLTEKNPDGGVVYGDYTHEIAVGGLYETPMEHVGEVWAAAKAGTAAISISLYG